MYNCLINWAGSALSEAPNAQGILLAPWKMGIWMVWKKNLWHFRTNTVVEIIEGNLEGVLGWLWFDEIIRRQVIWLPAFRICTSFCRSLRPTVGFGVGKYYNQTEMSKVSSESFNKGIGKKKWSSYLEANSKNPGLSQSRDIVWIWKWKWRSIFEIKWKKTEKTG